MATGDADRRIRFTVILVLAALLAACEDDDVSIAMAGYDLSSGTGCLKGRMR